MLAAGAGKVPQRQDLPAEDTVNADGHGVRTRSLQERARQRSDKTYSLKSMVAPTDMA